MVTTPKSRSREQRGLATRSLPAGGTRARRAADIRAKASESDKFRSVHGVNTKGQGHVDTNAPSTPGGQAAHGLHPFHVRCRARLRSRAKSPRSCTCCCPVAFAFS